MRCVKSFVLSVFLRFSVCLHFFFWTEFHLEANVHVHDCVCLCLYVFLCTHGYRFYFFYFFYLVGLLTFQHQGASALSSASSAPCGGQSHHPCCSKDSSDFLSERHTCHMSKYQIYTVILYLCTVKSMSSFTALLGLLLSGKPMK